MTSELLNAWSTVGGVLLAVLILLAMITIHEFGHYLAGKLLKFRIDEFSIGFGPALFKKRRKKSGELFALRLIPLGGYCAFHGEDGEEKPDPFLDAPAPLPQRTRTRVRGEVPPSAEPVLIAAPSEEPSAAASEESAKPLPVRESAPQGGSFTEMACWKRILVLVAGAFMNYLLALFLIVICFFSYGQSYLQIGSSDGNEAPEYSFRAGDILLSGGGKDFYLTNDVGLILNGKKAGDEVEFRVARMTENGYEETTQIIRLRSDVNLENSTRFTGVWKALGVGVETDGEAAYYTVGTVRYRLGFFPTVGHSFVYSYRIAGSVLRVIGELLTGKIGLEAFGGPVTTITTTAAVAVQGFASFLEIAALIGVNLAVFNLLPVPALDGCKIVFTLIEWIRGKPVSRKIEAIVNAVGFIFLLGFAILVDILQFV